MVRPDLGIFAVRVETIPAPSKWAALVLFAVTLALAGCGRKGGLDLPPNGTPTQPSALFGTQPQPAGQARTDVDAEAARESLFNSSSAADQSPVAAKGRNKPFVLDPLLGN
jgi:predicted small lipoprotein YifL